MKENNGYNGNRKSWQQYENEESGKWQ